MDKTKIEEVLSENLGEGYIIIDEAGGMTPRIEWIDWVQNSDAEDDIRVEVTFEDDTKKVFKKGEKLKQIWHEDIN